MCGKKKEEREGGVWSRTHVAKVLSGAGSLAGIQLSITQEKFTRIFLRGEGGWKRERERQGLKEEGGTIPFALLVCFTELLWLILPYAVLYPAYMCVYENEHME